MIALAEVVPTVAVMTVVETAGAETAMNVEVVQVVVMTARRRTVLP